MKIIRKMQYLLGILLILVVALPASSAMPQGENCAMSAPPRDAGELILPDGGMQKVFPRRSALTQTYTGCQLAWTETPRGSSSWKLVSYAHLTKGVVDYYRRLSLPDSTCRYSHGKVVGGKQVQNCPDNTSAVLSSMRPGCAEQIFGRAGNYGCELD